VSLILQSRLLHEAKMNSPDKRAGRYTQSATQVLEREKKACKEAEAALSIERKKVARLMAECNEV